MNTTNKLIGALFITLLLAFNLQADNTKRLLISLTSGDFRSTGSGVAIANAMQDAGVQTVVFINANSVKYALKDTKVEKFGPTGKSIKDMLAALVKKNATVMVCGMNAKFQGVKDQDLIKGIKIIGGEQVYGAVFAPNTQTLSF